MSEQFREIADGIGAIQLAGVDQAHVQITDLSPLQSLIEKTVFPVQNCFFQRPLRDRMPRSGLCRVGAGRSPFDRRISDFSNAAGRHN